MLDPRKASGRSHNAITCDMCSHPRRYIRLISHLFCSMRAGDLKVISSSGVTSFDQVISLSYRFIKYNEIPSGSISLFRIFVISQRHHTITSSNLKSGMKATSHCHFPGTCEFTMISQRPQTSRTSDTSERLPFDDGPGESDIRVRVHVSS